jgi:hypothetical protein
MKHQSTHTTVKKKYTTSLGVLAIAALSVTTVHAASIVTWNVARDSMAVSANSGLNTSSPTFGNNTAENVDGAFFTGEFGETISLAVGETLTVTYGITLTGGTNAADNFRFVVGDYGTTADQLWDGGWNYITDSDMYQARTGVSGNVQSNGGNAVALSATQVSSGTFLGDSTAAYTYTFSVTRDSASTVDLVGSLVGGNGLLDQTYTVEDRTTTLFDYNGVGLLFGSSGDLEQASLSNASYSVTAIPEPSSAALLGLGGLALIIRRRR